MKAGKYVVTGGSGFLGKALARRLRCDSLEVHTLSRRSCPDLVAEGIHHHETDIAESPDHLSEIFEGAEAVFHTAAKVEMWGALREFFRVNVGGTRNVLRACAEGKVRKLVFTSSPSVIADGTDLCGVDESKAYPQHFEAFYPQTKAAAEQEVLSAHEAGGLQTISLRPHLIFGPGDTNLVPTILDRARAGRLVQVGDGYNVVDLTFITDCVEAHIRAAEALDTNPRAGGRAYFISQGEPVKLWEWIAEVLTRSELPPLRRRVPRHLASGIAALSETMVKILPGRREPLLTQFLVSEMATSHYFDISAAKTELDYMPSHTMAEAMDITFGKRQ